MYVYMYVCMDRWIRAELHKYMYVYADTYTHIHIHTYKHTVIPDNMSFNQRIHVIIDMKEQIWMPNKNICDCHLTLNRH